MMTEKWIEEQFLASDVWGIEKSQPDLSPEETLKRWKTAVKVLDNLSSMAETLMLDPLILALVDAKVRAEEELERAKDRAEMGEPGTLHPREEKRLRALLRRSDALNNARTALLDSKDYHRRAEELEVLEEMVEEVGEQFTRYRRECGLDDSEGPVRR